MKRSGLAGRALVALLCVGAALVVARRFHDGDTPSPVPALVLAPVTELADSPLAGALPDVRPSLRAMRVSEFGPSPAALALERRLAAEAGTEAEYARLLGAPLRTGQTFADYIADLETRIARGDTDAMLKMAGMLDSCWSAKSGAEDAVAHRREADDDYEPDYIQMARLCDNTLVLLDYAQVRDRQAELVFEAVRRGDEAAILAQFHYPPFAVASDPLSEGSKAWVNEAARRLEALAHAGNSKAALALGGLYTSGFSTPQDFAKAAPYFRQVLDSMPMSKEEAMTLMLMPGPDKGRYLEIYGSSLEAEGMLRVICERIPRDNVAPGVCK
ncbi:MAG: hypothetical protein CVV15_05685 [Gammaproteobacteria bacterium HGW-Gammaproteobacteria-5]|nr:MAG: hypothetical protein CVV15_05685 [Gammaproteobacteria bacterium HGW-Gammaproteobacteria-5]